MLSYHGQPKLPPNPNHLNQPTTMQKTHLAIKHQEFGTEIFEITEPRYNLYQNDRGNWEFIFSFRTGQAIQRVKELEEVIDAHPNVEATAWLTEDQLPLAPGSKLLQASGYDYDTDEYLSNVYYFDHNTVEELEIEIVDIQEHAITLKAKGKAIINGSNGHEPDAELLIPETTFQLDNNLLRDF